MTTSTPALPRRLTAILLAAAGKPWRMVALAAVLVVAAAISVMFTFNMTTDTGELISARTPWRQDGLAVEHAFPQQKDAIIVVVDGQTPELAEDAAQRLASALEADKAHIGTVRRPDGGPFFDRNGLLFASPAQVKDATAKLIDAQPLLGGLALDPSLHGLATTIDTVATGAANGTQDATRLATPLRSLSTAIDAKLAGKVSWFSWQRLFSDAKSPLAPPTRRLLMVHPLLRFGDLEPGGVAVQAILAQSKTLGLDEAHGVRVGITGEIPLADEEFATIQDNIGVIGAMMAGAMLVCLWLATRSWKMVGAIMVTIVAGLVITLALGLLAVHRLNVLSVAFIPLFVGLGVDFGIQVAVRFNAERHDGANPMQALAGVGAIGEPLMLAAAAIFLALGAFLPTDYTGIAELGVIAGLGMIVAFALNITLLPALLILMRPAVPAARVGWAGAAPVDAWLHRHRGGILWAFVLAMAGSILLLKWVVFDFNPLHLRDPHAPAMRELSGLMKDADRTPNVITILASNADAARVQAAALEKHPEVAHAITIDSFVPEDQAEKLPYIQEASLLLDAAVNPFDMPATHSDDETRAALTKAAASLRLLGGKGGDLGPAALALASSFDHLAAATPPAHGG
jgi:hopanoid biosynthesis associated RND transporter like protein HpnN